MAADAENNARPLKVPYRRLPGRGRRVIGGIVGVGAIQATLWLGPDHLLVRDSVYGVSESYKRFYFQDIEAIIVRKTPRWLIWNIIWAALAAISLGWYALPGWRDVPLLATAGCFLLGLLVNALLGPTCVTHLRTAVQKEELPPLNRLRKARRVLGTLLPVIAERQGILDPATLAGNLPGASPAHSGSHVPPMPFAGETARAGRSWIHAAAFVVLLLSGGAALWEEAHSSALWLNMNAALLACAAVLVVCALIAQGRRRVAKPVMVLTWIDTGFYIIGTSVVYMVYVFIYSFQRATSGRPVERGAAVMPSTFRHMPGFDYVLLTYGICSLLLGALGLVLLFTSRPAGRSSSSAPPPIPGAVS
jgi:hypothetical protein